MIYKLYTLDNQFIKEINKWPLNFTGIIENAFRSKHWFDTGKLHRIDGPAIEYPVLGEKQWWLDDKLHRFDGPAIEYVDGTKAWYIDGKRVTEEQHKLLYSIMKLK